MPRVEYPDYTLAELENLYREAHPDAARTDVRREAKAMRRRLNGNPARVLGISWLPDPTPSAAFRNLTNDRAAARRLGLA